MSTRERTSMSGLGHTHAHCVLWLLRHALCGCAIYDVTIQVKDPISVCTARWSFLTTRVLRIIWQSTLTREIINARNVFDVLRRPPTFCVTREFFLAAGTVSPMEKASEDAGRVTKSQCLMVLCKSADVKEFSTYLGGEKNSKGVNCGWVTSI